MIKGFRDFILRGSLIDLVTAFVLGHAVHTLVLQFSSSFGEPFIRSIDRDGVGAAGVAYINGVAFDWAAFASSVLHLCVVSLFVYFALITPVSRIRRRLEMTDELDTVVLANEHAALLREIRDLLKHN